MGKRIIAVNAGPRKGWNTDTLIMEAARGAESAGAEVQKFDLFRLEKYTGCISCFGCKKEKNMGHATKRSSRCTAGKYLTWAQHWPVMTTNPIETVI